MEDRRTYNDPNNQEKRRDADDAMLSELRMRMKTFDRKHGKSEEEENQVVYSSGFRNTERTSHQHESAHRQSKEAAYSIWRSSGASEEELPKTRSYQYGSFIQQMADNGVLTVEPASNSVSNNQTLPPYRSPMTLANITVMLLSLQVVYFAYSGILSMKGVMGAPLVQLGFGSMERIAYLLMVLSFAAWTYRLYRNLSSFKVMGYASTPVSAALTLFIPIANLYKPIGIFNDVWKASNPIANIMDPFDWKKGKANALIPVWWCTYLLANISLVYSEFQYRIHRYDVHPTTMSHLLYAFAMVLTIAVVMKLSSRQDEREYHMHTREITQTAAA